MNHRLDPIALLDALRARKPARLAFNAKTPAAARLWQRTVRAELSRILAVDPGYPKVPLRPRRLEQVRREGHIREKWLIQSTPWSSVPVYLLRPDRPARQRPCIIAYHGHGYGVKDIVGLWPDGSERRTKQDYHFDFAVSLVERGFLVAAPEIACFGERQSDYRRLKGNEGHIPTTCHHASTYAMMLGVTVPGMRVWDGMRTVDFLLSQPDADPARLGAMGISGGGMHTYFSSCLDPRIKAAVISGYFCDWRHCILDRYHCTCNFVPGLLTQGELSDFAGLIAPRPLLVENGDHDPIFPIKAVKATVKRAGRAWALLGADQAIATDYFEGNHRISGRKAFAFLEKHLGPMPSA